MEIGEFERRINELIPKDEEMGLFEKVLEFYVLADGCLGAQYDGVLIPSEGVPWNEALDTIVEFIKHTENKEVR